MKKNSGSMKVTLKSKQQQASRLDSSQEDYQTVKGLESARTASSQGGTSRHPARASSAKDRIGKMREIKQKMVKLMNDLKNADFAAAFDIE